MSIKFIQFVSLASIVALTACGGGGGSSKATPTNPTTPTAPAKPTASYNTLVGVAEDIVGEYDMTSSFNADYTENFQMPSSGKATYVGAGAYREYPNPDTDGPKLIGKSVLTANFSSGKVTGKVTDFKAAPGHTTTGGRMDVDTTFVGSRGTGKITGNVNLNGRNIKIDDRAIGSFYGSDASGLLIGGGGAIAPGSDHVIAIVGER